MEKTGTRLNKHEHTQLYQAIQTCAENAANRKLSKKKNGKDILDKAQFIENLGLTETVELAKEAIPYHRKINGKSLTQDVQLTATDVNAVTPQILRLEVPVGVPLPWPTDRPPTGWLLCNGDRFDKTRYPLLASAYPSGQLPDLRGEFIRGADAGRKIDTGRKVLSTQGDAIRNITGQFGYVRQGQWGPWVTATGAFYQTSTFSAAIKRGDPDNWGSVSAFDASRVVPTAHENRPRNVAFNYIVRGA
ncbi:phage tail protein [Candidatus Williamhamiltonella defendens]|nr:phage tail protein [Candidatus Hamiltonella defensa]